eukprot:CAMPEP_0172579204 /NCGR_PEP_ID=MMETSP1067-20121228/139124_1 /TAXON_ID=265564 ORGANISM="Thalassiosira punctigera, Strain Tpunct2005C2" /NCGR_SAMPLE_ID=MMETSP1067 /ASSEMBLY_ACC=CAM_ASM_000444 /LENGTH=518 /DNA_ID=CAMNT_0013371913 /DNA_START=147 /DNA_END=1703 /DNA_ORIENTATION=-
MRLLSKKSGKVNECNVGTPAGNHSGEKIKLASIKVKGKPLSEIYPNAKRKEVQTFFDSLQQKSLAKGRKSFRNLRAFQHRKLHRSSHAVEVDDASSLTEETTLALVGVVLDLMIQKEIAPLKEGEAVNAEREKITENEKEVPTAKEEEGMHQKEGEVASVKSEGVASVKKETLALVKNEGVASNKKEEETPEKEEAMALIEEISEVASLEEATFFWKTLLDEAKTNCLATEEDINLEPNIEAVVQDGNVILGFNQPLAAAMSEEDVEHFEIDWSAVKFTLLSMIDEAAVRAISLGAIANDKLRLFICHNDGESNDDLAFENDLFPEDHGLEDVNGGVTEKKQWKIRNGSIEAVESGHEQGSQGVGSSTAKTIERSTSVSKKRNTPKQNNSHTETMTKRGDGRKGSIPKKSDRNHSANEKPAVKSKVVNEDIWAEEVCMITKVRKMRSDGTHRGHKTKEDTRDDSTGNDVVAMRAEEIRDLYEDIRKEVAYNRKEFALADMDSGETESLQASVYPHVFL